MTYLRGQMQSLRLWVQFQLEENIYFWNLQVFVFSSKNSIKHKQLLMERHPYCFMYNNSTSYWVSFVVKNHVNVYTTLDTLINISLVTSKAATCGGKSLVMSLALARGAAGVFDLLSGFSASWLQASNFLSMAWISWYVILSSLINSSYLAKKRLHAYDKTTYWVSQECCLKINNVSPVSDKKKKNNDEILFYIMFFSPPWSKHNNFSIKLKTFKWWTYN